MRILKLTCFFICLCQLLTAQSKTNTGNLLAVNLTVGYQNTGGDLADRFGTNSSVGLGMDYITPENWIFGLNGNWIFGNEIKEDVIANLRTKQGAVVANNSFVADILLRMRSYYGMAHVGKLIPISKSNKRSGIRLTVGGGLWEHKIRIQDDPEAPVASLLKENKKGYDRLTRGLAINEFVGYQYFAKNHRINFYIGLEFTQGFTKSVRGYNYDTRSYDTERRFDALYGGRIGWILPFYLGKKAEEVWY